MKIQGVTLTGGIKLNTSAAPAPAVGYQGESFGYITSSTSNRIEKYSYISDANSSDVGSISTERTRGAGSASSTAGFVAGGNSPSASASIDKFPFATDTGSVRSAGLAVGHQHGGSASSAENGYVLGGENIGMFYSNQIQKYSFSNDATAASDVADLLSIIRKNSGTSSTEHGYSSGGRNPLSAMNIINKFPFSSDSNATDVGNLIQIQSSGSGSNSYTHGYYQGGDEGNSVTIQKFPFASDADATDVGDLGGNQKDGTGSSSTSSGYAAGSNGAEPQFGNDTIEKYPYASDSNSTDVGNLTQGITFGVGSIQV